MNHSDDRDREVAELLESIRSGYHPPPPAPREEMWAAIRAELPAGRPDPSREDTQVVELDTVRRRHASWLGQTLRWAAAAAAVLVLGIGIGRRTATHPSGAATEVVTPKESVLNEAALEHLGRTESLLTMVRAEGRSGSLDPQVGVWARGLLTQTRLFLDSPGPTDPAIHDLMEDLELVLAQIVGVTEAEAKDGDRAQAELNLALHGLEDRNVLARIRAVS